MIWIAILSLAFLALLIFWVAPRFSEYRATLGINEKIAAAQSWSQWLALQIKGLKTVIVGGVGTLAVAIPELSKSIAGIDLKPLLGQDWAQKVVVGLAIATTITHVIGIMSSAKAEPVRPEGE